MKEEPPALVKTLEWVIGMVAQADASERHRIVEAVDEAHSVVSSIDTDENDSPRPKIIACFERSDALRAGDDIACVGWLLVAIRLRASERDLPVWQACEKSIDLALTELRATPLN